jgi:hypothetical protein
LVTPPNEIDKNGPLAGELWIEAEGVKYLFHYTEIELAREIAEDGVFEVGPGARYGPGLYATDIHPNESDPEEIRAICFEGDAADNALNAVLVLLGDDHVQEFEAVPEAPRIYRLPAEVMEAVPIDAILVGIGQRGPAGWSIEAWE